MSCFTQHDATNQVFPRVPAEPGVLDVRPRRSEGREHVLEYTSCVAGPHDRPRGGVVSRQ